MSGTRRTVDDLLREAREQIAPRPGPDEAKRAVEEGALLIDVRSSDVRARTGVIPGSVHIPLAVLEWRCDPDSEFRNPAACDPERKVVLFCSQGYVSSLAAASLRRIGFEHATDLDGGFDAWRDAGLPVRPAAPDEGSDELPGMRPPEPAD